MSDCQSMSYYEQYTLSLHSMDKTKENMLPVDFHTPDLSSMGFSNLMWTIKF